MNRKAHRFIQFLVIMLLLVPSNIGAHTVQAEVVSLTIPACVTFESLTATTTYVVGDTFVDAGTTVSALPFTWANGTVFNGGSAVIGTAGLAGGSGNEINTNNINLDFDFGVPLSGLRFAFGEYGGNLNISINGDFRNFANFADIDGIVIGGASVSVINGFGNDMGTVTLAGTINQFAVGGQELWIDNLCPAGNCIDFEGLPAAGSYVVGDTFSDSGALMEVLPFTWSNGTVTSSGSANVGSAGLAGGSGQELNTNNVNVAFHFMSLPLKELSLRFGEYGGNLNIEINGDFKNFDNFVDIDGAVIGGVSVSVTNGLGNDKGTLKLSGGFIHTFSVGGQELWIDDVCPVPAERIFLPIIYR